MRGARWCLGVLLPTVALPTAATRAQVTTEERAERVAALLREHDPLHDGAAADALLPADRSLDTAIAEAARTGTVQLVQQRALRLWRAIGLAERVRTDPTQRDVAFWLAFAELDGLSEPVRTRLLA